MANKESRILCNVMGVFIGYSPAPFPIRLMSQESELFLSAEIVYKAVRCSDLRLLLIGSHVIL